MRVQGWERRLADFLEGQKNQPFEWGKNDCILFASKAADQVTDRDLVPEMLGYGEYDKARAVEILREHGGDISGIFDKHFKRRIKAMAKRGDIALVKRGATKAAGVVVGRFVICKTAEGVVNVPIKDALMIWGVD